MLWFTAVFTSRAQAKAAFAARRIGAAAVVCVPFAHVTVQQRSVDLLITNANVIDVQTGGATARRALAIRGDTIVAIGDTRTAVGFRARQTVNARGKYVIPGLWDMHMHFGGGPALIAENRALMPPRSKASTLSGPAMRRLTPGPAWIAHSTSCRPCTWTL